ncbi:dienelactone hydrolase family protein [Cellulomonas sp. P5_C6]
MTSDEAGQHDPRPLVPPADAPWTWPVSRTGDESDPPVIVMHELFGVTPDYLAFCERLRRQGFDVWMPQILGPPRRGSPLDRARAVGGLCISREIDILWSGRTSPVVGKLRALARYASHLHGDGDVGVVGMCMSGGFALALAAHPNVAAAVAAEPAIPFRPVCGRALGLSPHDVGSIRDRIRADDVEIYYTRFRNDPLSPRPRLAEAVEQFGDGLLVDELPGVLFPGKDHSVLTVAHEQYGTDTPQGTRLAETAERVGAFLHRRLDTA